MLTILTQTGEAPVRFSGEEIAAVTHDPPAPKSKHAGARRWHVLKLFQHDDGRYVASVGFRSQFDMEEPHDEILIAASLSEMADELADYDPTEFLHGYPQDWEGSERRARAFQTKQQNLERRVTEDYDNRVSQLLLAAGYVEEL